MAEIYQIPEGGTGGVGNIPFTIPLGGNNGMFGNGSTNLMDLLGFAIVASMFGWGNGGFGGGFGGGANGAGFISNQLNNDSGRELIMNAITSQGEAQRTAIQTLATTIGQDFNLVNGAVMNIQNSLNSIANNQGMNALQVINAIQSGNATLASQLANCCCQNQLATCQQTYALTDTMNRNYSLIDNKLDAMESARKDREITALTAKVAQLESQNFTTGVVQQAVSPILGQLANISNEVEAIKRCQPATVTLPNNQYTAVPTILANAGADFVASYWANRLSQATTDTTAGAGA